MAVEPQANVAMARRDPGVRQQSDDYRHTNGGPVSDPEHRDRPTGLARRRARRIAPLVAELEPGGVELWEGARLIVRFPQHEG